MFGFGPATRIYVATGATDMRKGFNDYMTGQTISVNGGWYMSRPLSLDVYPPLCNWPPASRAGASQAKFCKYQCQFRDRGSEIPRRCKDSPCCNATEVREKGHNMRTRYFGWEYVFKHICQHCDRDGFWDGDAETLAADFHVSEDQADETLSDLADRGLIEKLVPGKFAIVKWPERDEAAEDEAEQ
jgi:hypothetical protein